MSPLWPDGVVTPLEAPSLFWASAKMGGALILVLELIYGGTVDVRSKR